MSMVAYRCDARAFTAGEARRVMLLKELYKAPIP